ncbi:hypothetical protein E1281_18810 [Actinomadura sp. KC345]|uniref:DUF5954 family protein n=1 Tax=Actinomadura sp. KC345 TaxID=2530371 RepID=UPI001044C7AF|nr:DUF5954 family protein [Actinomadura sp. KC345]TDC52667.1 hypothetical protein E1281_18810 [Actinomadura sp. KC345]
MSFEGMPGHDLINVVRELEPVAAVRDQEAAERRRAYPEIVGVGPPEFGCAEQAGGGWRILSLGALDPGEARVDLAVHLRGIAADHEPAVHKEMLLLADALEEAALEGAPGAGEGAGQGAPGRNECAAGPLRFRVVRVLGLARFGGDGPEPARVTDGEDGPLLDHPIDPAAPVGPADAALRQELLSAVPAAGTVPDEQRHEAAAAVKEYPGVVLLPPDFTVMEDRDDQWRPITGGTGPQDARDSLAHYFRALLPLDTPEGCAPPSPGELAEYARAADRIDADGGIEFVACGRRFRIVRVIRMIRVGPDGPEPPRRSDEDL